MKRAYNGQNSILPNGFQDTHAERNSLDTDLINAFHKVLK